LRSGLLKLIFVLCVALPLSACMAGLEPGDAPLPDITRTELASQGLELGAPVYVRIFKLEAQMEVWLGKPDGTYQLFRSYDICNYSGDLGPKIKEGDKQAPEGYYVVTSKMMNPNSKYHLSFNIGFPNKFDRAHGRTGSALMVHGGCLSKGCYAITDEAIEELYILAREAFNRGQRNFPLHAYPFQLTKQNLALHKDSQWRGFWANLKVGYDMFEKTRIPPIAAVSGKKYVFYKNETVAGGDLITGW
jgi:murein L,D-transpeptidase YafK